jgi:hypothetical protein
MGRFLLRFFSVLCIGGGVGLLAWGISAGVIREPLTENACLVTVFPSTSAVIGWGAGVLAIGITTLALTFADRGADDDWEE